MRLTCLFIGSVLLAPACGADDGGGLSSTGSYNVNAELGEDVSGSTDDGDDTDDQNNEDAPVLTDFSASLESASGVNSIALVVSYTDKQGDLEGGSLYCRMSVSGGNDQVCVEDDSSLGISGGYIPIDGTAARLDEDQDGALIIKFNMERDEGEDYYLEVFATDEAGNTSNTIGADAE